MPDLAGTPEIIAAVQAARRDFTHRWRTWLLGEISDGAYLAFGPFGVIDKRLAMPIRAAGNVIDIATWPPKHPDEYQTLFGAGLLGVEAVTEAILARGPLRVFRHPWGLLQAAAQDPWIYTRDAPPGCVILPAPAPSAYAFLARFPRVVADDKDHARELERLIRAANKRPPRLSFPKSAEARSAA